MSLSNKIDFAVTFRVKNANPNGDPLNGNRPRITFDNTGEVSDVCLKRKIRNRLMEKGFKIFVQSDDNRVDEYESLRKRAEAVLPRNEPQKKVAKIACDTWLDVRAFGQVFAFSGDKKGEGLSIGIRGPVSIHPAFSIGKVEVVSNQITKSVSSEGDGSSKGSDTMGMKHRIEKGVYVFYGSMNPQLAVKTGFNNEDANALKEVLPRLFENDASSARPEGSMEILNVFWWKHKDGCPNGEMSSAKIHRSLSVNSDGSYHIEDIKGPVPEILSGF
jgi:CRISPR-associated protein Csd2